MIASAHLLPGTAAANHAIPATPAGCRRAVKFLEEGISQTHQLLSLLHQHAASTSSSAADPSRLSSEDGRTSGDMAVILLTTQILCSQQAALTAARSVPPSPSPSTSIGVSPLTVKSRSANTLDHEPCRKEAAALQIQLASALSDLDALRSHISQPFCLAEPKVPVEPCPPAIPISTRKQTSSSDAVDTFGLQATVPRKRALPSDDGDPLTRAVFSTFFCPAPQPKRHRVPPTTSPDLAVSPARPPTMLDAAQDARCEAVQSEASDEQQLASFEAGGAGDQDEWEVYVDGHYVDLGCESNGDAESNIGSDAQDSEYGGEAGALGLLSLQQACQPQQPLALRDLGSMVATPSALLTFLSPRSRIGRYVNGHLRIRGGRTALASELIAAREWSPDRRDRYLTSVAADCQDTLVGRVTAHAFQHGPTRCFSLDDLVASIPVAVKAGVQPRKPLRRALDHTLVGPVHVVEHVSRDTRVDVWERLVAAAQASGSLTDAVLSHVSLVVVAGVEVVGFEMPRANDVLPQVKDRRFVVRERYALLT